MDMIPGLKLSFMSDRKSHVCTEEEKSRRINCFSKRGVSFSFLCCAAVLPYPERPWGTIAGSGRPHGVQCTPSVVRSLVHASCSKLPRGYQEEKGRKGPPQVPSCPVPS